VSRLLEVEGLTVAHADGPIVDDVSFHVERGEALALAGESGCGKTTTALSLLRLLPPSLTQTGKITLDPPGSPQPINIGRRTETGMQLVRWRHISLVFQGAMNSLDPVRKIDHQIGEAINLHEDCSSNEVRSRTAELLETVGLTAALGQRYAHQLSGGQRQRVMIALALACRPSLVIADEPTTALDVVMQAQVLQLLAKLRQELGLALILISHDLGVLAETCDRIAVMYAGRIVEMGPVGTVFSDPQHPYTKRLLASLPVIGGERGLAPPIPGGPPDPGNPPPGCRFHPRCPYAEELCTTDDPASREAGAAHEAACHFAPWSEWPQVAASGAEVLER
jgi:peptide/nickel transport system ATP-binding protein